MRARQFRRRCRSVRAAAHIAHRTPFSPVSAAKKDNHGSALQGHPRAAPAERPGQRLVLQLRMCALGQQLAADRADVGRGPVNRGERLHALNERGAETAELPRPAARGGGVELVTGVVEAAVEAGVAEAAVEAAVEAAIDAANEW
eukprot:CAMPEP_0175354310 /NCGR_PEP_ID=MMETSP0095-20121207/12887_1 /TAXON_ID=311494 /ORGANISM="Alexandrium monilatum, Strain CCMP3105" /LENGTH=144 /DNA_ID=CAMNT_0016651945 /DNA_START=110 /DNA_END=543 /DNA_ORIENTATION=-